MSHPFPARPFASKGLALVLVVLAALLAPASRAAADTTPIAMSAEQVRQALVVTGSVGDLSTGPLGTRDLLLNRVLIEAYAIRPDLASADAVAAVQALRAKTPAATVAPVEAQAPNEGVLAILQQLDSPHPAGIGGQALSRVIDQALQDSARTTSLGQPLAVDADSAWTLTAGRFDPIAVLSRAAALAKANASFAQAWDALWAASAGYGILASTPQLLSQADALKTAQIGPIVDLIASDGTISTTLETVDAQADTQNTTLHQTALATIASAAPGVPYDATAAATRRATTTAAVASTSLLSKLAAITNSATAKRIAAAGAVLGKLGESYDKWSKAVQGLSGVSRFANLSTLSMAGGVLGAVQLLGPVFGLPDQNSQMKAALAQISQQISELRDEMNDRFDVVDSKLDAIGSRLDSIATYLQGIAAKIDTLQASVDKGNAMITQALQDIATLQVSVDRLQASIYLVGQDTVNTDTWRVINSAIGYQQGNAAGDPLPTGAFVAAAGDLYTYGTTAATGNTLMPIAGRSWAPDDLATELNRFATVDSNMEYLRQLPARRFGLPPLGDSSAQGLANPQQWALSSHALSQLLLENVRQTTATQLNQVHDLGAAGERLRAMMRQIGTTDTATRSGSRLFNALLDEYARQLGLGSTPAAASVIGEMHQVEDDYLATLSAPGPVAIELAPDVFGDPAGALPIGDLGPMPCTASWYPEELCGMPYQNHWDPTIPETYRWAYRLGLGVIRIDYDQARGIRWFYRPVGGAEHLIVAAGGAGGLFTADSPAQRAAAQAAVVAELQRRQRALYSRLAAGAADQSTPLAKALRRTKGVKDAIEAYLHLGLGGALAADDELQELLTDGNRLLEPSALAQTMHALAAPGSTLPSVHPRSRVAALQQQRASDLEAAIKADLVAPEPIPGGVALRASGAPGISEFQGNPLIDGTLNRMALSESVVTNPPPPDGTLPTAPADPSSGGGDASRPSGSGGGGAGGGGAATPAVKAPVLTKARLAAAAFKRRKGTKLSFQLDRAARVTIVLERAVKGRKAGRKCKPSLRTGKRCTLLVAAGTKKLAGRAGRTTVAFGAGLRAGTYVATLTASADGKTSAPVKLRFAAR